MKSTALAVLCVLISATPVSAAIQSYSDRAAWLAAVGAPTGGEDFNGFLVDTTTQFTTVAINGGTMTSNGALGSNVIHPTNAVRVPPMSANDRHIDSTAYLDVDVTPLIHLTFDFQKPVMAWGADMRRSALLSRSARIDVFGGSVLLGTVPIPYASTEFALEYYGFTLTDGAANRLVIVGDGIPGSPHVPWNTILGVDNVEFLTVPEPSALALLVPAFLAFRRRRPT